MLWNHLNDPEDEKSVVVTLFVAVCRVSSASSLFFLRAQCPLKLTFSSSLSNRKLKNNLQRWNKKINRGSWFSCTWTAIDRNDRCPFARACSSNAYINVRFVTYSRPIRDRDRDTKFEQSRSKTRNKWHAPFCTSFTVDFSNSISWNRLDTRKGDTRPETVPTCPALPAYN